MTDDIFQYIDVERTIAEFGHDPRELSRGSHKKVIVVCSSCNNPRELALKNLQKYKSSRCFSCFKKEDTRFEKEEKYEVALFIYVNIEETIKEFGYDPRNLKPKSHRKVVCYCKDCGQKEIRPFLSSINMKKCVLCERGKPNLENKNLNLINDKKTMQQFGYSINTLSKGSAKLVVWNCNSCLQEFTKPYKDILRAREGITCFSCRDKNTTTYIKKGVDEEKTENLFGYSVKKLKENSGKSVVVECNTCREVSIARYGSIKYPFVCKTCTLHQTQQKRKGKPCPKNSGKKNPRWGKVAPHGKGEWYVSKSGKRYYMRSTWEVKYARHLDEKDILWEYESKTYEVYYNYLGENKESTYTPDFFINDEWVEIKGWWRKDSKAKFEAFKAQYPDEKITLLMKPELLALGIDVK